MLARRGSNWNAPIWLVRVQNATTILENRLADSTKGPAIPLLGFYPGEMQAYVHTTPCTRMFIAAFFLTARNWKHVSIKEQTRKGWGMHTAERHSEIKRNRPVTHATIWMNFKIMMLFECSQMTKSTYYIIPFMYNFRKGKLNYSDYR